MINPKKKETEGRFYFIVHQKVKVWETSRFSPAEAPVCTAPALILLKRFTYKDTNSLMSRQHFTEPDPPSNQLMPIRHLFSEPYVLFSLASDIAPGGGGGG